MSATPATNSAPTGENGLNRTGTVRGAPQQQTAAQQQQAATQQAAAQQKANLPLPTDKTLQQAFKLSLKLTKPVCTYFYIDSVKGKVSIETREGEKIVYKNDDEHTSPILNTYKSENSYIVVTENTIYLLSSETVIKA